MFEWHKKSKLTEQLKFFGAKKQGFISVYAKKPRIRVKVKIEKVSINVNKWRFESAAYVAHLAERRAQAIRQFSAMGGGYGLFGPSRLAAQGQGCGLAAGGLGAQAGAASRHY